MAEASLKEALVTRYGNLGRAIDRVTKAGQPDFPHMYITYPRYIMPAFSLLVVFLLLIAQNKAVILHIRDYDDITRTLLDFNMAIDMQLKNSCKISRVSPQ